MPLSKFAKQYASSQGRVAETKDLSLLGGLVEEEHPTSIAATDLRKAKNCARRGRALGTRPGCNPTDPDYDAAISGTPAVQAIYEFRRNQDANRDLVVVAGGAIYTDRTTTLNKATNSVTVSSGANNLWTFATFQNKLFAAGGATMDSFWNWDGSAAPNKVDLSLTAGAKYVFSKWNFVFLAGFGGTAYNDNPMVVRYCDWGTDATDAANWNVNNVIPGVILQNNFGPGSYGREFCTGLASYQDNRGDFLLMLTNRRLVAFRPNVEAEDNETAFLMEDAIDTGCMHQNAFVNLGLDFGDAVYFGPNGIHSLSMSSQYGNKVQNYLSWPIRKTFENLNLGRSKYVSGAYWPYEGLVTFVVSSSGSSTHNLILAMDIKDAAELTPDTVRWFKWELPTTISPNVLAAARGTDDKPHLYLGDTAGNVFRFGREEYTDNSITIPVEIETASTDYGYPSAQKTIGDTFIGLQGEGGLVKHQVITDDGSTVGRITTLGTGSGDGIWGNDSWGGGVWGATGTVERHRVASAGTSVTVGHRFTSAGSTSPFWITALSQTIFMSGPSTDTSPNTVT